MNKREKQQVIHCDTVVTLKDGKGTCPKCKRPITVLSYKVGRAPEKPSHKKKSAPGPHDSFTMWFLVGAFLLVLPPFWGAQGLLSNVLASWDNLAATLIVISMIIGTTILFVLFGGSNRKA